MTALERDYVTLIETLTPALKQSRQAPKRFSKAQRQDLSSVLRWNADRNIVGFGVGPKPKKGKDGSKPQSLVIFVVRKLAKSRVPKKQLIPQRIHAECIQRGLTTDVVEVGEMPMLQASASLNPGSNAAHFTMRSGSVTAIVSTRGVPKLPFLLSCCHVFAPSQVVGNPVESPPDPSAATFTNRVADVATFEPLRAGGSIANRMDAALARPLTGGPTLSNIVPGVGKVTSASPLQSGEFLSNGIRRVLGVGAVTGRVQGEIIAERVSTLLADPFGRRFLFQDVIAYRPSPVTQAGDSGMPILSISAGGLQLLGMHIGLGRVGTTGVGAAFFVPIAPVLNRLRVDLA